MRDVMHGIVMYDFPVAHRNAASRLKNRIRKFALWINDSAYLFPWENKATVMSAVVDIRASMPDGCLLYALAQHPETSKDLLNLAAVSVQRLLGEMTDGLAKRIAAAPSRVAARVTEGKLAEGLSARAVRRSRMSAVADVRARLAMIKRHCVDLKITGATEGWVRQAEEMVKAEAEALERAWEPRRATAQA